MRLLGLPYFENIEELANLIHIDSGRLKILIANTDSFYRKHSIAKRDGRTRVLHSPSNELKAIQAWILRHILDRLSASSFATAYAPKSRLIDNLSPHISNRYFLSIDIKDFFPSVRKPRVSRLFDKLGYGKTACYILTRLCTYKAGLPQGGVTSPCLSNLVCLQLDRRLAGLTSRRNVVFTRYADDITFSTNNRGSLTRLLPLAYQVLREEGFQPNIDKQRFMGPFTRCAITGLIKNSSEPSFGVGKTRKRQMRAVMYTIATGGVPFGRYPNESSIAGWLSFVKSVDPAGHRQMEQYWTALKGRVGVGRKVA